MSLSPLPGADDAKVPFIENNAQVRVTSDSSNFEDFLNRPLTSLLRWDLCHCEYVDDVDSESVEFRLSS